MDGSMIDMPAMGATNWPPPSYDPQTELFYLNAQLAYGMAYLYDTSDKPEGYGGGGGGNFDNRSALLALDIRTGAVKWKHEHAQQGFGGGGMSGGILTTAGKLLFTGDSGHLVAFDPADGKILWNQRLTSRREQRAVDVDAGRQAIPDRGRGRHAVRVHARGEKMKLVILLGCSAALLLGQDVDAGQKLFESTCGRCHGARRPGRRDGPRHPRPSRRLRRRAARVADPHRAAGQGHAAEHRLAQPRCRS